MVEVAKIVGVSLLQTDFRIFLPISAPVIVVVLIWQFTSSWNDFLIPVALTQSAKLAGFGCLE